MQYYSQNGFYCVSRITGPSHNILQLKLSHEGGCTPLCECLPAAGGCDHGQLDKAGVLAQVINGVKAANKELGTSFVVAHIKYIINDSPSISVYRHLAQCIVERLANGEEFN